MLQLTTIFFLISLSVLAGIDYIAVHMYLYWRLSWFDMPMHFLGGITAALALYTLRDFGFFPERFLRIVPLMLSVLCIAIMWEIFQLFTVVPVEGINYYTDTSSDIFMGVLGSMIGYFIGRSLRSLH